jgi:hypothetical protein
VLKLTLRVLLIVAVIGGVPVFADIVALGEGVDIGSWSQRFGRSGASSFDRMAVEMFTDGVKLVAGSKSGMGDFSAPGWNGYLTGSGSSAVALGPHSNDMEFDVYFSSGRLSTSFTFNLTAWHGDTVEESHDAHWDSGSRKWSFCPNPSPPPSPPHVPEASTVVFGGGWLLGLALLVIRRKGLGCTAA